MIMDILFVLGTKAQFIKTIPMINLAINRNLNVTLVDLKQHPEKSSMLIKKIKGEYKYRAYFDNKKDLGTYPKLIYWFFKSIIKIIFIKDKTFKNKLSVVHGDTLSALIGAILIRINGGKLVLLEAGKGFPGMLKHFPESFVRYYVAKFSHYLIANGEDQVNQLKEWKVKGELIEISRNTIYDSLDLVDLLEKKEGKEITVSIHRTENINNKENMKKLVSVLSAIDEDYKITWHLHIPTKNRLKAFGLINELTSKNINLKDLISYENFLNKLYNSDFVITDGDGVTEECYILGVPTLVWRYEHLDSNHLFGSDTSLFLSGFDMDKCLEFFNNYKSYRKDRKVDNNSPSNEALDKILDKQNNL